MGGGGGGRTDGRSQDVIIAVTKISLIDGLRYILNHGAPLAYLWLAERCYVQLYIALPTELFIHYFRKIL